MTPPSPHSYRLSILLAQGEEQEALRLLEILNLAQRVFGYPDYTMPQKHGPADGLVTCPAIVEVEHLGPGRIAA